MKRLLGSLKVITIAMLLMVGSVSVSAQTIDGCYDFIHAEDIDTGQHYDCYIDSADEDWCYYWCYPH